MKATKILTSTFVLGSLLLGGLAPAEAAKLIRTWGVEAALSDSYHSANHNHVAWMPDLPGVGSDFIADGDITFNEFDDGTANLFGSVVAEYDADKKWDFNVWFEGSSSTAGTGGPKKELNGSAYSGPVDTNDWYYYDFHSSKDSVFTGVAGSDYDGKMFKIDDVTDGKYLAQVGVGANGKNTNMGLSTWFKFEGDYNSTTHADFNIDLVAKELPSDPIDVPEPGTIIGLGVLALGASQLKRKNNN